MQSKYPKILIISAWYPNTLHESEGDFVKYQAELLRVRGQYISVFHACLSIRLLLKGRIFKTVQKRTQGLEETIVEKPFWPRNSYIGTLLWAKRFKKEVIKHCDKKGWPDVIHAHTYLGGYIASLLKKERNLPYLVTLHSSFIVKKNIPNYHRTFLKSAVVNANKVIAVGKELADAVEKNTEVAAEVRPNFIDFMKFQISQEKKEKFTFVFVGELIARKRVGWIINTFVHLYKKNKSIHLIIIGEGPNRDHLYKLVQKLKVKNAVEFTGRLSQNKVSEIMSSCHCLVLASETESFGIVLTEAMACGLPFISTRSGVPEEWFNHEECHFVDHDNEDLLMAMNKIIKTEVKRKPKEIRRFAKERFNTENTIDYYAKVYLSLSEKGRP